MIIVNALKVRAKLGGILDKVAKKGETVIIERLGKPMAVIVPYDKSISEKVAEETRRKRLEKMARSIDKWREKTVKNIVVRILLL